MFPQVKESRRRGLLSTVLLFTSAFLVESTSASPSPATAPLDEATANTTLQDLSHLYLAPEASCASHEGQWNCLSDRFQHCTDGQWSAVLSCSGGSGDQAAAAASLCSPLGRTDLVDFEGECSAAWGWGGGGGSGGWGGGGGTSCNGNRCYYGAGERLDVERWVYVAVVGAIVLGVW